MLTKLWNRALKFPSKNKKVAVGISGGVDSSVAALLLKEQGYDVRGVYLKCWDAKGDGCTADEDRASAVSVAVKLGIKLEVLDYTTEYSERVIKYFYEEYRAGRTPNPDIMCNTEIKFGMFLDWALEKGYDYVATGHYAQVKHKKGGLSKMFMGTDMSKDQSYFLYRLKQAQLQRSLFPLGSIQKSEVRELARKAGLSTYRRPDSQGICFVGKVNIKEFLKRELSVKTGKVLHVDGSVVGTHDGVWFYTIGQRHGFDVKKYYGLPLYVVDKKIESNELVVGFAKDVLRTDFKVIDLSWISGELPESIFSDGIKVRIRHLGKLHGCRVVGDDKKLSVNMQTESFGIAPGQSAVFYKDGEVLGGGIIA